jgi:GT2 family glycosyltransferase
LDHAPGEIILVDDGSSDGSVAWVRKTYPETRIFEMGQNTKRLNKVRNWALREATYDLVLLVDNDVKLKSNCLEQLLVALRTIPDAAVCMPRALYDHDPSIIYQDGQLPHYVGASHALNRNRAVEGTDESPRLSIGWGVQLIAREKAAKVGFFNEAYIMGWGDDGEFNHKMNLAGYRCYHVPKAICYHKRVKPAERYYGSVRNRWRFLLEMHHWKTLLFCFPALVTYEIAAFAFLVTKGSTRAYWRSIQDIFKELPEIWRTRQKIQSWRQARDSEIMTSGPIFIPAEYVNSPVLRQSLRLLNGFLDTYWRLVRRFL